MQVSRLVFDAADASLGLTLNDASSTACAAYRVEFEGFNRSSDGAPGPGETHNFALPRERRLQPGMRLVRINAKWLSGVSRHDVFTMLRCAGRPLELSFARVSHIKEAAAAAATGNDGINISPSATTAADPGIESSRNRISARPSARSSVRPMASSTFADPPASFAGAAKDTQAEANAATEVSTARKSLQQKIRMLSAQHELREEQLEAECSEVAAVLEATRRGTMAMAARYRQLEQAVRELNAAKLQLVAMPDANGTGDASSRDACGDAAAGGVLTGNECADEGGTRGACDTAPGVTESSLTELQHAVRAAEAEHRTLCDQQAEAAARLGRAEAAADRAEREAAERAVLRDLAARAGLDLSLPPLEQLRWVQDRQIAAARELREARAKVAAAKKSQAKLRDQAAREKEAVQIVAGIDRGRIASSSTGLPATLFEAVGVDTAESEPRRPQSRESGTTSTAGSTNVGNITGNAPQRAQAVGVSPPPPPQTKRGYLLKLSEVTHFTDRGAAAAQADASNASGAGDSGNTSGTSSDGHGGANQRPARVLGLGDVMHGVFNLVKNVSGLQRRWCVLADNGTFAYYRTREDEERAPGAPRGTINLRHPSLRIDFARDDDKKKSFVVEEPSKNYTFVAESTEEAQAWLEALSGAREMGLTCGSSHALDQL